MKVAQGGKLAISNAMRALDVTQGLWPVFRSVRAELVKAIETLRVKLHRSIGGIVYELKWSNSTKDEFIVPPTKMHNDTCMRENVFDK